jgi:hypothetical protein
MSDRLVFKVMVDCVRPMSPVTSLHDAEALVRAAVYKGLQSLWPRLAVSNVAVESEESAP